MADSSIKQMADILAAHPLFAGLDSKTTDLLAGCAKNEHFADGACLFKGGRPCGHVLSFARRRRGTGSVHARPRPTDRRHDPSRPRCRGLVDPAALPLVV